MPVGNEELQGFIKWYSQRFQRKTGRLPSPASTRARRHYARSMAATLGAESVEELATLLSQRSTVEHLLDVKAAQDKSAGTVQNLLATARAFGEYAKTMGWTDGIAVLDDDKPAYEPERKPIYTPEELDLLVTAARGVELRWWAFMATMVDTGRRVGEVLAVEWDWLRLATATPHIMLPKGKVKTRRQQSVPLTHRLYTDVYTPANIEKLKTDHGKLGNIVRDPSVYIFPWSYGAVNARMRRFCGRIGVEYKGIHQLRHSFATHGIEAGVPLAHMAALLGHNSPMVTASVYNHLEGVQAALYTRDKWGS